MKTWIEQNDDDALAMNITQVVNFLVENDDCKYIEWHGVPKSKRRKVLARAIISNNIIDELNQQVKFLVTGK